MKNSDILVSFVHGYHDLNFDPGEREFPALWINKQDSFEIKKYPFPRNVSDFIELEHLIIGEMPSSKNSDFKRLPRFGLTGLAQTDQYVFAGSWNAIYKIDKKSHDLVEIISHRLMNDMHGIWADEDNLITILTGKDTVVISDHKGLILDYFTVKNDLSIVREEDIMVTDWRFLSKQYRGSTGIFHFNYVQKIGNEIWLTARNLNAFVVVNLLEKRAHVRTINQKTVVLLHDGLYHRGEFFFTSIDGKIIIADDANRANFNPRENFDGIEKFSRDLVSEVIRLNETELGREPNWCRGIACVKDLIYVTIDGLYDTDLSFGLLGLRRTGEVKSERRLKWADVGDEKNLRYVSGFDVLAVDNND